MTTRRIKDFATGYLLAFALIFVFALAVAWFLEVEPPLGVGLVPFIVGVQVAAQRHAKRTGARPSSTEAWRAALAMTLATFLFAAALTLALAVILGFKALFGDATWAALAPALAIIIGFLFMAHVVVGRFFFSFMVGTALKAEALKK